MAEEGEEAGTVIFLDNEYLVMFPVVVHVEIGDIFDKMGGFEKRGICIHSVGIWCGVEEVVKSPIENIFGRGRVKTNSVDVTVTRVLGGYSDGFHH